MNAPTEKPERSRFVVSESKALTALPWWLKDRKFTDYWPYLVDREGHRMVGLNYRTVDENGRETLTPCGIVLIKDLALADQVISVIREHMHPGG